MARTKLFYWNITTPQAVWEYAKSAADSTGGTVRHGANQ
jgi:hypothetical protein